MSVRYLLSRTNAAGCVGSVLHGAYGDYYEQLICLRYLKYIRPDLRIALFFASEERRHALRVYDLSFADGVYPATCIGAVEVDTFLQFQIRDAELKANVLDKLGSDIRRKFDWSANIKPWTVIRALLRRERALCDLPLNGEGQIELERCLSENGLEDALFRERFTVGFLWRYRKEGEVAWGRWQTPEPVVEMSKAELLRRLVERCHAHVIIAGMKVKQTPANELRLGGKYPERGLNLPEQATTYLSGSSWALEVEILRRCSLCLVMPSGFSEALLFKRDGPTVLVDPPPYYLGMLLRNRMPLFHGWRPRALWYLLRQPHSASRVWNYLDATGALPPHANADGRESTAAFRSVKHSVQ